MLAPLVYPILNVTLYIGTFTEKGGTKTKRTNARGRSAVRRELRQRQTRKTHLGMR
jgi:hypothetical protein